ncbi:Propionyl-CoA carboxylase alpha chain, mitochondrial [Porphyridium purpureum]|uniref:Propionyl-CoA carboxylase alpha chain, mitochondrial n=1 Tax=Porphyridium purpureum TaxID=35688 RepID=A0A5J4Z1A7_PORPP|nr:Propionyl-CoA carboxylase alpha chain, mitochondrial [Porphyridium purpureum]|eukprot:POR5057..scf208_2
MAHSSVAFMTPQGVEEQIVPTLEIFFPGFIWLGKWEHRQTSASVEFDSHCSGVHDEMGSTERLRRVLIANRGEIVLRFARAARALRMESVSIFSQFDRDAPHTRGTDFSVFLGGSDPRESYLNVERVVDAAARAKADAVAPGYGFLSENPLLASALHERGIVFVGPPAHAIEAMGDKIESKRIAKAAGMNMIPGFVGQVENAVHAKQIANDIGYPVMIKASAGGGGKGMRVAYSDAECVKAFNTCKSEALSFFGNDALLVEKFIEKPRHIEIQLLADKHNNVLYFPERECSMQRRNQKVIEEAPSPFGTPELRRAMGSQAVALARKVGYESAGTVEFLVSGVDASFYFLEMNTRLQVEHPITEAISGVDLAQWMIRIAQGEKLDLDQETLVSEIHGHAFEARLYAENPARHFIPCTGTLHAYKEPVLLPPPTLTANGTPDSAAAAAAAAAARKLDTALGFSSSGVRVDSGVTDGSHIGIFYDPMLAKLVVHAPTRDAALRSLGDALDRYIVQGVQTNLAFLRALTRLEQVITGDMTTKLFEQEWPDGFKGVRLSPAEISELMALVAVHFFRKAPSEKEVVIDIVDFEGQVHRTTFSQAKQAQFTRRTTTNFDICGEQDQEHAIQVQEYKEVSIGARSSLVSGQVNGVSACFQRIGADYYGAGGTLSLLSKGAELKAMVRTPFVLSLEPIMANRPDRTVEATEDTSIRASMTGCVRGIFVSEGDVVREGQDVLCLEAMKMQTMLTAPRTLKVLKVACSVDQDVQLDQELVVFEPPE